MPRIFNNKMIFYAPQKDGWVKTRPISVKKTKFQFPSDINAVFESNEGYFYFFRNDYYCKKRLNDNKQVITF